MGLFGKMFEKKSCSVCGGEIGLLGNRKLEDGNLCKNCAAKLSPWFSDRRRSTVDDIKAQLQYREENKQAVAQFNPTLTYGQKTKVMLDEDSRKFIVTGDRNFAQANPDVLDYSQVTGVDINIDEKRSEERHKDSEGKLVSYNPPRYTFSYDFDVIIRVNHPYFDEIKFRLNPSSVTTNTDNPTAMSFKPDPRLNQDYREYSKMGEEIKEALTSARQQARDEVVAANTPKAAVVCKCCGASTIPDAHGCCEYCGGAAV